MTKKECIALANAIRWYNAHEDPPFVTKQIEALAVFCRGLKTNFKYQRWLDYIAGKCGPNGGRIR
jgi:hypothetical protein